MTLTELSQRCAMTAIYPRERAIEYTVLGLCGESGELANKLKKRIRDYGGKLDGPSLRELGDELFDVLWYVAAVSSELDREPNSTERLDLETICERGLKRLMDRQHRGTLSGSGDYR